MLIKASPVELVGVREALGPGALPDGDQPVLVWMQHPPLLPHRLWVGNGCRKEAIIFNSSVQTSPLVVAVAEKKMDKKGQENSQLLTLCEAGTME